MVDNEKGNEEEKDGLESQIKELDLKNPDRMSGKVRVEDNVYIELLKGRGLDGRPTKTMSEVMGELVEAHKKISAEYQQDNINSDIKDLENSFSSILLIVEKIIKASDTKISNARNSIIEDINKKDDEIREFKKKVEEIEVKIENIQIEYNNLNKEHEVLKNENIDLKKLNKQLADSNKALEKEHMKDVNESLRLYNELDKQKYRVEKLEKYEEENKELVKENVVLKAQIDAANKSIEHNASETKDLKNQVDSLQKNIYNLNNERNELIINHEKEKLQIEKEFNKRLDEEVRRVEKEASDRIFNAEKEKIVIENEREKLAGKVSELEKELTNLNGKRI